MPERIAGKRGRTRSSHAPELLLHNFRGRIERAPIMSYDAAPNVRHLAGILGNDNEGDCGPCAVENARIIKMQTGPSADGGPILPSSFIVPTTEHTLGWYHSYGRWLGEPGTNPDQGVDNLSMLTYLFEITEGVLPTPSGHDVQAWAFCEIDASNANEVHQAVYDFKGLILGCCLTDNAEAEFERHSVWNVTAQERIDPTLGHDVYLSAFDQNFYYVWTWNYRQPCTIQWEQAEEGAGDLELWAIVTEEDVKNGKLTNTQFQALLSECSQMGGKVNPNAPKPTPPSPTPSPVPSPVPPAPTPASIPPPSAETIAWMQKVIDAGHGK